MPDGEVTSDGLNTARDPSPTPTLADVRSRLEFTESENPWAPIAIIEEINEKTGSGLVLTGLAEQTGGISSAAFVRWPDGRDGALTRTDLPITRMRQTAELLSTLRANGAPAPTRSCHRVVRWSSRRRGRS